MNRSELVGMQIDGQLASVWAISFDAIRRSDGNEPGGSDLAGDSVPLTETRQAEPSGIGFGLAKKLIPHFRKDNGDSIANV